MYFHTDRGFDIAVIANALLTAATEGRRVRIDVDSEGSLKVKIGEGMWSAPFASTPDPYRDLGAAQHDSHDLSNFED